MILELKVPEFHLIARWQGKPIFLDERWMKVRGSVETKKKFKDDVDLLVQQIRANGFESFILVLDGGDKYIVLDGFRRCFAFAGVIEQLQREGKPLAAENGKSLELRCEVYDGDPSEDAIVAKIVRINLARSNLGDGEKKNLILIVLKAEAARGVFRTTNWIAADLGVSQRWLSDVRNRAIADGVLPWNVEYKGRDGWTMPSGISQPKRKVEELPASSPTKDATTTNPAVSGASATDTKTEDSTVKDDSATPATPNSATPPGTTMSSPTMSAPSKPAPTEGTKEHQPESPRYEPERHPATEALCALVKESQRQPKDLDPDGRFGIEGLVNRHDLQTPLGRALSDYLDPLFAALGIDLDLALRHFAAMVKDATTRKEVAAKAEKKKTRHRTES